MRSPLLLPGNEAQRLNGDIQMYTHILISTDGSELAQRGVDHGLSLAKALGAKVTAITVSEPIPFPAGAAGAGWVPTATDITRYETGQKEHAEKLLGELRDAAAKLGVETKLVHAPDTWPAEAIVQTAKAEGCNLIVMASHGRRGLGRLILGSQTSEVLSSSPIPVLVVK
jgi:nucleotide-binding universal stress UspA family protein